LIYGHATEKEQEEFSFFSNNLKLRQTSHDEYTRSVYIIDFIIKLIPFILDPKSDREKLTDILAGYVKHTISSEDMYEHQIKTIETMKEIDLLIGFSGSSPTERALSGS
jgi:hypothetical protein